MTNDIDEARARRDKAPKYEMAVDFQIDGDPTIDAQSFVLGVEFWQVFSMVRDGWRGSRPIHRANYDRLYAAASPFASSFSFDDMDDDSWVELRVL